MVKQLGKSGKLQTVYWSLVSMVSAALISVQPVMADTIWDRFSTIMKDVYGEIVAISTIVAVTVAAIALVVRMVSRNQRAVDEANCNHLACFELARLCGCILTAVDFWRKLHRLRTSGQAGRR